jgi:alpha-tubulin suppressor-like RCC1 family protein
MPGLTYEVAIPTPTKLEILANETVTQVACGEAHTVALTDESKVWGWGMSMYGQLGLGFSGDSFEPGVGMLYSKVSEPTEITPFLPPHVKVAQVSCGAMFTLFVTKDNELYGCGINDLG